MDKEFVTYEQALALKELGFDEECMANCMGYGKGEIENGTYKIEHTQIFYPNDWITSDDVAENLNLHCFHMCKIPLKQQVFKWLSIQLDMPNLLVPVNDSSQNTLIDKLILELKSS